MIVRIVGSSTGQRIGCMAEVRGLVIVTDVVDGAPYTAPVSYLHT
jgi:hypothetical protein